MLALFLGAGFSKWVAGLPVAHELFDFNIEPWGQREVRKLEIVKSIKRKWDRMYPSGIAEQFIADSLNLPEKKRQAVLWYIVRRLSEPFVWKEFHAQKWRRHVLMIDENRKFNVEGVVRAQDFLKRLSTASLRGIITTNYDMIVEYALGTKGFNYGIPRQSLIGRGPYPLSEWRNPVKLEGHIPLAKIHGSISWDENAFYTNGRRGLTGHALVAAPTPEKQPPRSLEFAWNLAERIPHSVDCMVIFGFAFNPYDEAVLNMLEQSTHSLKSVLLVDVEPKTKRARELWPDTTITFCPPPSNGYVEITNWLISHDSVVSFGDRHRSFAT